MEEYIPAKEAAKILGMNYSKFIARKNRGKINAIKKGWSLFVHRDEIARLLKGDDNAPAGKNMEASAR